MDFLHALGSPSGPIFRKVIKHQTLIKINGLEFPTVR